MDNYLKEYLKSVTIDHLMNNPVGETFERAIHIIEKIQLHLQTLSDKNDPSEILYIKIGTVLTFSLLNKLSQKKSLSYLTKSDWNEIAESVSKYAILMDKEEYSTFVFVAYEHYIRSSANQISQFVSLDKLDKVIALADELHHKNELFQNGEIDEIAYIEDCMWISLEAIMKLIVSLTYILNNEESNELIQAISCYAFEYGRYLLYQREQVILNELIESQHQLDQMLTDQFEQYKLDLEERANQFFVLIENAFSPNFREIFLNSITLARAAGVDDSEILNTIDDVDLFFTN